MTRAGRPEKRVTLLRDRSAHSGRPPGESMTTRTREKVDGRRTPARPPLRRRPLDNPSLVLYLVHKIGRKVPRPVSPAPGRHSDRMVGMSIDWAIALAGLGVGFIIGLTGMGGGALMTP